MKYKIEQIKNNPLFTGMTESEITTMLPCLMAKTEKFDKSVYVWSADSQTLGIGLLLTGSVHIVKEDFWGNRAILAKIEAGGMFGEAFACARTKKLPVSVVTADKTEILFLNYQKIVTTCSSACVFHSRLIQNMLQILAEKNILLTQKMEFIVRRTTREKLLAYLSSQAVKVDSNSFTIPFNRQELADYLSVDRSAMSNELSKLRDEGVLEFHRNYFRLLGNNSYER